MIQIIEFKYFKFSPNYVILNKKANKREDNLFILHKKYNLKKVIFKP